MEKQWTCLPPLDDPTLNTNDYRWTEGLLGAGQPQGQVTPPPTHPDLSALSPQGQAAEDRILSSPYH